MLLGLLDTPRSHPLPAPGLHLAPGWMEKAAYPWHRLWVISGSPFPEPLRMHQA